MSQDDEKPDAAHVEIYLDDAVIALRTELDRLDNEEAVIAEARRRIEGALLVLDVRNFDLVDGAQLQTACVPDVDKVDADYTPPAQLSTGDDPSPPAAPDWVPFTGRRTRGGEEWLDVDVECPVEGCGHDKPMRGMGLRAHLATKHKLRGAKPSVKERRDFLVSLAVDIANGAAKPGKEPLWPADPEPMSAPPAAVVLRTLPPEEQGVVENHCGDCGEFESECTCDDDEPGPPVPGGGITTVLIPNDDKPGTFVVTSGASTSSPLAFEATAAEIDAAVEVRGGEGSPGLRCIAREEDDERHQCAFTTDDPDQLARHMRRRHPGWASAEWEDVVEAVQDAQSAAGLPRTFDPEAAA